MEGREDCGYDKGGVGADEENDADFGGRGDLEGAAVGEALGGVDAANYAEDGGADDEEADAVGGPAGDGAFTREGDGAVAGEGVSLRGTGAGGVGCDLHS